MTWPPPWASADPDAARETAKALTGYGRSLQSELTSLQRAVGGAFDGAWAGITADKASADWQRTEARLAQAVGLFTSLGVALTALADVLATAVPAVRRAQTIADDTGLTIGPDGTATMPEVPGVDDTGDVNPAEMARWQRARHACDAIAALTKPAMVAFTDADQDAYAAAGTSIAEAHDVAQMSTAGWASMLVPESLYLPLERLGLLDTPGTTPPLPTQTQGPTGWDPFGSVTTDSNKDGCNWRPSVMPGVALPPAYSYAGGGFVTGPDGREYPLVIPQVTRNGSTYNAGPGVLDLNGHDPGWVTTSDTVGVRQEGKPASAWDKAAAWATMGQARQQGNIPDPDGLADVTIYPDGSASLDGGKGEPGEPRENDDAGVSREKPEPPEPQQQMQQAVVAQHNANRAARNRPPLDPEDTSLGVEAASGGVAVVNSVLQGGALAHSLDDGRPRDYQVLTQVNVDGRTRAIVTEYQTVSQPDGTVVVQANLISAGPDGSVVRTPINVVPTAPAAGPSKLHH